MKLSGLLFSFLLLPVCMFARVTGTYAVMGYDPIIGEEYTGTIVITKSVTPNGKVYTATWTYEDTCPYIGTGVCKDDAVSFVFTQQCPNALGDPAEFGTQLYEVHKNGLKGPWILFGDTRVGYEKLIRVDG